MRTITEIKEANQRAGRFYFSPDTMRFFRSRVGRTVVPLPNGGALFVTSEQFVDSRGWHAPRKYSIRLAMPDGEIESVGGFQTYNTNGEANQMMRRIGRWCHNA